MIITINTKEDSKEELKKVIAMLTNLVNEGAVTNSADFSPVVSDGIFGLFNNEQTQQAPEGNNNKEDKIELYDY